MKMGGIIVVFLMLMMVFAPIFVFAGDGTGGTSGDSDGTGNSGNTPSGPVIQNPLPNITDVASFVKTILEGVIKIGVPVIALAIVYSGFLFVTARGKPEALGKAKDALLYTVIGAALLLGAWALAQTIANTVLQLG